MKRRRKKANAILIPKRRTKFNFEGAGILDRLDKDAALEHAEAVVQSVLRRAEVKFSSQ